MISYSSCNGISAFIYRGDLLDRSLVGKRKIHDVEEFVEVDDEEMTEETSNVKEGE